IKAPEEIREKEIEALENLAGNFPYSQALHVLIAKGATNCSLEDAEKKLNHAAVYTADRKNLKQIIENTESHISENAPGLNEDVTEETDTSNDEQLKGEIKQYIEKLKAEKLNLQFESEEGVSEEAIEERNNFIKALNLKIMEAETKLVNLEIGEKNMHFEDAGESYIVEEPVEENDFDHQEENSEDNVENPVYSELEENLRALKTHRETSDENQEEEGTKLPPETITTLSNNVERERMEEYLASLKASEEETISNEKLKEQLKIINKFIENEPKLSRLEREEGPQTNRVDLSLKSLRVHQNIASENLALIMVKQGKLDKAEEIYNKLIWKFPEKKAYFVAQIEELKKK